jgi:hypothetical protein
LKARIRLYAGGLLSGYTSPHCDGRFNELRPPSPGTQLGTLVDVFPFSSRALC